MSETFVFRWVLKGGISIGRCPALSPAAQYVLPSGGTGNAAGVFKYRVFPFGTLLGPEITGPKNFKPSLEGLEGTRVRVVSDCSCAGPRLPR